MYAEAPSTTAPEQPLSGRIANNLDSAMHALGVAMNIRDRMFGPVPANSMGEAGSKIDTGCAGSVDRTADILATLNRTLGEIFERL